MYREIATSGFALLAMTVEYLTLLKNLSYYIGGKYYV